jgi:hypothetical protein
MTRFAWMQSRVQSLVAAIGLLAVAVALALTGPHLAQLYHSTVTSCTEAGDCANALNAFVRTDAGLRTWLGVLVVTVPGLLGIFWGAPLVAREIEAGTYRLAWTQSVSRTRWLLTKLGLRGLISMATAGLLSLLVTWWASPLDRAAQTAFSTFDGRDLVPIGYAAFAFVLGVTAGVVTRRVVPAMGATLVAFVAGRIAFSNWIRPLLFGPVHQVLALDPNSTGYGSFSPFGSSNLQPATPTIPNAWIYSTQVVDKSGHPLTTQALLKICPTINSGRSGPPPGLGPLEGGSSHQAAPQSVVQALHDCVARVGVTYHELVTYQPGSRYWGFQVSELAIFLAASLAVAGFCLWWVRHRLS